MRKQRYARSLAKNKSPERVNTSTYEQDKRLLDTTLKGLKAIWAEDKDKPTKKGSNYNSIAQFAKNAENNFELFSVNEADLTPEELEARAQKEGGQTYLEMHEAHLQNKNNPTPFNLLVTGDKVEFASKIKNEILQNFSEEDYQNYILYTSENQPVIDRSKRFEDMLKKIPAKAWSEDYAKKRGVNPEDFIDEERFKEINVSKYDSKMKGFIDGLELTPENTHEVTKKVLEKIDSVELPPEKVNQLKSRFTARKMEQEKMIKRQIEKKSADTLSSFLSRDVINISDYRVFTDSDTVKVVQAKVKKDVMRLDSGTMSWSQFSRPQNDLFGDTIHNALVKKKVSEEYTAILQTASGTKTKHLITIPKNVPRDEEFAVELTYNYFNERKRQNPDITMDDVRAELYDENGASDLEDSSKADVRSVLRDTYEHIYNLGLGPRAKREYLRKFRTPEGRQDLLERAIRNGIINRAISKPQGKLHENTFKKSERPEII